jgi:DNA replication protein DnaC
MKSDTCGLFKTAKRENKDNASSLFHTICPRGYREIDAAKFENPEHLKTALEIPVDFDEPGYAPGLLLFGKSGTGKTRTAWKFIEKAILTDWAVAIATTDGLGWKNMCWQMAMEGAAEFSDFIEEVAGDTYEIFFLDDLDKDKLTAGASRALLHVIEQRTANHYLTVITTGISGVQLERKIIADMQADEKDADGSKAVAESIIRRFRDTSLFNSINFNAKATKPPTEALTAGQTAEGGRI